MFKSQKFLGPKIVNIPVVREVVRVQEKLGYRPVSMTVENGAIRLNYEHVSLAPAKAIIRKMKDGKNYSAVIVA